MRIAALAFSLAFVTVASAEERADVVTACVSAFAKGDTAAFEAATTEIRSWGAISDENLSRAANACLALAPGSPPDASQDEALADKGTTAPTEAEKEVDLVDSYVRRLEADPKAIDAIAAEIATDANFSPSTDDKMMTLETALLEYVRPLPAAKAKANRDAYLALSRVMPENTSYADKVKQYDAAIEAQARADKDRRATIVSRLVKNTAEFDGSSWYRHPSSPRYQDMQSYVTLYIVESGSGTRSIEFFLNFTSRTGWLFVESAQINVDGNVRSLPTSQWYRDNDTEIWEWTGYSNNIAMLELAREIAESDRSVVRFNGQQFYDDHVVSDKEKSVIRDMLLAWEEMKS